MRKSSARQQEFDFSGGDALSEPPHPPVQATDLETDYSRTEQTSEPALLKIPTFGVSHELYAVTSRLAGRLNAASVSQEEYEALLKERQSLLDKKFDGTMTRKKAIRLDYVNWSLDRIEDARHGTALDMFEGAVSQYEQFLTDLQNLTDQLSSRKRGR